MYELNSAIRIHIAAEVNIRIPMTVESDKAMMDTHTPEDPPRGMPMAKRTLVIHWKVNVKKNHPNRRDESLRMAWYNDWNQHKYAIGPRRMKNATLRPALVY